MATRYDFLIIGAGAAGEAAAQMAARRGASAAIVERELIGGSCAYWACMPSKSLLHDARIHSLGGDRPWLHASNRRDYMINRQGLDRPDDGGHLRRLEEAGVRVVRGDARLVAPGQVAVTLPDGTEEVLEAANIIVAVGTHATIPPVDGLDRVSAWTNRQGTATRELPESLIILGGGPTGVELGQVFARYGVPVTLVHARQRLNDRDHPRSSDCLASTLRRDGVDVRTSARAERITVAPAAGDPHTLHLAGGDSVKGHEILLAVGRTAPLDGLGLERAGARLTDGRLPDDGQLRLADGLWVIGDPAGPEMHTHLAHYQGEMAVRMALGDDARPDYRAIPRAVYTDPPVAGVGLTLEQAREAGRDAHELVQDLATTAPGYIAESEGHVTIVFDRAERVLLGAFISGPGAGEAIHEAVLAIKTRVPLETLADTLHAFPTTARVMGGLFARAAEELRAS
jgi:pyruvate/2-oxoglutarate dehydrogenase complex dihydrolipoamide dehydrogenase (E3) component